MTILAMACRGTTEAPASWPQSGCASEPVGSAAGVQRRDWWLESGDGQELWMEGRWPKGRDCSPAVLLLPGGFQAGTDELDGGQADALAASGIAVLVFDPSGRGKSEGEDDHNGFAAQDETAEVLRWLASNDDVDPTRVLVRSRSFGGALAAGALTRHPDLRPLAWVDVESPGWLEDELPYAPLTNQQTMTELAEQAGDPAAWWAEREPAALVAGLTLPYHRVQGLPDHALDNYMGHAVAMLEQALPTTAVFLNEQPLTTPLTEEEVKERAVHPGIDASDAQVTAWMVDLVR
jgi:pimeloyl-ACP methyl ester carboxylesterase